MKDSFSRLLNQAQTACFRFDAESENKLGVCLKRMTKAALPKGALMVSYYQLLLFLAAHPRDRQMTTTVQKELRRIGSFIKRLSTKGKAAYENSGLPFSDTVSSFSHDFTRWLHSHPDCNLMLETDTEIDLNEILAITLPAVERSLTTAGYSNAEILSVLGVKPDQHLEFYLSQLEVLSDSPTVKDTLFDKLNLQVRLAPRNFNFSTSGNRLRVGQPFFFSNSFKVFDSLSLIQQRLPKSTPLQISERNELECCIKMAMATSARETDPITYTDARSLRLYSLERGIQVALYSMTADRQLPLESYVGYMILRNGYPTSYGGAWVFGNRANFGINILEAFRGGESGYLLCQLLRVYHQVFDVSLFEVEPYQYGLDNPDGIRSGAFWFYYRYGFRPVDKAIAQLARRESEKKKSDPSYASPKQTLLQFTECNMALRIDNVPHPALPSLTQKITRLIATKYHGDRQKAISEVLLKSGLQKNESIKRNIATDFALLFEALSVSLDSGRLINRLAELKMSDPYRYQSALRKWLKATFKPDW